MPERHLNLHDKSAIQDFIESAVEYLPAKDRKTYLKLAEELAAGKHVPETRKVEIVRNLGAATWPMRRALQKFFEGAGAEMEWEAFFAAARPTTVLLLKRLRASSGAKTLDEALASSDAPMAIHDQEEIELETLRPEIRIDVWQKEGKHLGPMVGEARAELEAIRLRLKQLRELAAQLPKQASLLYSKIEHYEDRVYFGGETIPLDVLDGEIAFAREDAALPPADDVLAESEDISPATEKNVQGTEPDFVKEALEGEGEIETLEQKEEERKQKL